MIDLTLSAPACIRCELHVGRLSVCVSGRGPERAPFLVVGEAPGSREDVAGVAFVGRSGQLLDGMMADAGFAPHEWRVTNAVRCQPPVIDRKQQAPTTQQIDACREHLRAEILSSGATTIIALGEIALQSLCKGSGIGGRRGNSYPLHESFGIPGVEVWPTYHPAFVARQMHMRDIVVVPDLRRIRASSTPEEIVPFTVWDGSPLAGDFLAFDIETIDEEGNIVEHPTQIAVASRIHGSREAHVVVTQEVQAMSDALHRAQDRGALTIGHNSWGFDVPRLRAFHTPALGDGLDTLVLSYLDGEQQPLGLEALAVRYLGVRGWKEVGRADARLGTYDFQHYNARDAWYTLQLAELLWNERLDPQRRSLAWLLLHTRRALEACSRRGLPVDQAAVEAERIRAEQAEQQALGEVMQASATDVWRIRESFSHGVAPSKSSSIGKWLFSDKPHNPNSSEQVALILMSRGYRLRRTPKGKWQVTVGDLQRIDVEQGDGNDPYIAALLALRKARKRLSTYVVPYQTPRVHNKYSTIRVKTNRTSASQPNVQNVPRGLDYFKGLKVDYAAIEFRTGAWCAGETSILERYQADPNWDPHRYFAQTYLYKREIITPLERQIAKSANFSQEYDGTWVTIQEYAWKTMGVMLSREECEWIHNEWHRAFPAFRSWKRAVREMLRATGEVRVATGFVRHFGDYSQMVPQQQTEAVREAMNCQSQTLAAHIAFIGLCELHRRGHLITGFFHDAVSFDYHTPEEIETNRASIIEAMTVVPKRVLHDTFGVDFSVPLVVAFSCDE